MRTRIREIRDRIINHIIMNPEVYKKTFKREDMTMEEIRDLCEVFGITIPSFYRIKNDDSPLVGDKTKGRKKN